MYECEQERKYGGEKLIIDKYVENEIFESKSKWKNKKEKNEKKEHDKSCTRTGSKRISSNKWSCIHEQNHTSRVWTGSWVMRLAKLHPHPM